MNPLQVFLARRKLNGWKPSKRDLFGMPKLAAVPILVFGFGMVAMANGVGGDSKTAGAHTEPTQAVVAPATADPKAPAPTTPPKQQGVISQWFGGNRETYKRFGVDGHTGIDIAADCGVPAFAPASGTIMVVGDQGKDGYGKFVRLATYGGESIILGHFATITATQGQNVSIGQQIATVGTSGNSTGCHVHFELHPRGANPKNGYGGAVNPKDWKPTECNLKDVPAAFGEYFCAAAAKYPLRASMNAAIIAYENRFNVKGWPDAPLKYPWPCSHAGACGPAQFIEPTWETYGVDGPALYPGDGGGDGKADRNSLSDAIFSSANYLSAIAERKPDPGMVAAEYNCGPKCGGPMHTWPYETRDYVPKVLMLRKQFQP